MIRSLLCALLLISLGSGLSAEDLPDSLKTAEVSRIDTMFVIPAGPIAGSFTPDCRMQIVDTVAGWAKIQVEGWVPVGFIMNRFATANSYYLSNSTAPSAETTPRQQCAAITKKGTQCTRAAKPGSKYCWQHQAK